MGYIGAIRQAEAFVWSKKEGLLAEVFWNEDAQEPILTSTEIK
jgi:phage I-like protein